MEEGTPTALNPLLEKLPKWLKDHAGASRSTLDPSPHAAGAGHHRDDSAEEEAEQSYGLATLLMVRKILQELYMDTRDY